MDTFFILLVENIILSDSTMFTYTSPDIKIRISFKILRYASVSLINIFVCVPYEVLFFDSIYPGKRL